MTQDLRHRIEDIINRNPQVDDHEIVLRLKQLLIENELQENVDKDAKIIADIVVENMNHIKDGAVQNNIVKSGFDDFDTQFFGFRLGEFVVLGGRPAMGKTQFLVNLSLNISRTIPVLYITLDLSEYLLTNRFIASVSEISADKILRQELDPFEWVQLDNGFGKLMNHQLFIYDCANTSIETLKTLCQKQIRENGIKVIMIDYLQLISSYEHRKYRENEVSHISRELKNIAKENNVCVIVSSQLSRAVEYRNSIDGKRPLLSDLRESGAIEQDADKVIFIYRPEYYKIFQDQYGNNLQNIAEFIVAKNRNGKLGEFHLLIDSAFTNFRNNKLKETFSFSVDRLLELGGNDNVPF